MGQEKFVPPPKEDSSRWSDFSEVGVVMTEPGLEWLLTAEAEALLWFKSRSPEWWGSSGRLDSELFSELPVDMRLDLKQRKKNVMT